MLTAGHDILSRAPGRGGRALHPLRLNRHT